MTRAQVLRKPLLAQRKRYKDRAFRTLVTRHMHWAVTNVTVVTLSPAMNRVMESRLSRLRQRAGKNESSAARTDACPEYLASASTALGWIPSAFWMSVDGGQAAVGPLATQYGSPR